MTSDLQKFNDMLAAMQAQRDQALNAVVMARAESAGLRRELAAKDAQIAELQKTVNEPTAPEPYMTNPSAGRRMNGGDAA